MTGPDVGEGPRDACVAIGCIAAVVWTAGFILSGLPRSKITPTFIRAMHKLQFAYLAPVIALLAPPFLMRTIAAAFFLHYSMMLIEYIIKVLTGKTAFMGVFESHIKMAERAQDRTWSWACIENDLIPTAVIFYFASAASVACLALYLLFTGYQGLLKGLYHDLNNPEPGLPNVVGDDDNEIVIAIKALTEELRERTPVPQATYFSIFGPKHHL